MVENAFAIKLAISYLQKRPSIFKKVLALFRKRFAYSYDSHENYYKRETLIDILWKFSKNGGDEFISKLFIRCLSCFLQFEFEETQYKNTLTT